MEATGLLYIREGQVDLAFFLTPHRQMTVSLRKEFTEPPKYREDTKSTSLPLEQAAGASFNSKIEF